jgi:hypothetical protein
MTSTKGEANYKLSDYVTLLEVVSGMTISFCHLPSDRVDRTKLLSLGHDVAAAMLKSQSRTECSREPQKS